MYFYFEKKCKPTDKRARPLLLHSDVLYVVINSLNLSYSGGLRYHNCHNFREDFIGLVLSEQRICYWETWPENAELSLNKHVDIQY